MTVIWSPLATEQLAEAAAFIARDDREAAERWVAHVFERVEQLTEFPESGRVVPELRRQDVREIIHGAYRIIYRPASSIGIAPTPFLSSPYGMVVANSVPTT